MVFGRRCEIPEEKIRQRYDQSRRNLLRQMPHLQSIRVSDNSEESKLHPQPMLILEMKNKHVVRVDLGKTPKWAKPIVVTALAMPPISWPISVDGSRHWKLRFRSR